MELALRLGARGWGKTSPNPMVGAVVVKDGKIVGMGYHEGVGLPHAEVMALTKAGENAKGAVLYVSLEPCCHYGRTPPCTDEIIRSGIKRVVIPLLDPNPLVSGGGVRRLREAGIEVTIGVCKEKARKANEIFFKWIRTNLPFVILKVATSIDGRIAGPYGRRIHFTCEKADREVHRLRAGVDAILIGRNTLVRDDPLLTVRFVKGKNPERIIISKSGRIPRSARIFSEGPLPVIVATNNANVSAEDVEIWHFKGNEIKGVDLLKRAGSAGISSILIEGGTRTISWALREKIVDKIMIFISPIFVGKGKLLAEAIEAFELHNVEIKRIGSNVLISGYTPWGQIYDG